MNEPVKWRKAPGTLARLSGGLVAELDGWHLSVCRMSSGERSPVRWNWKCSRDPLSSVTELTKPLFDSVARRLPKTRKEAQAAAIAATGPNRVPLRRIEDYTLILPYAVADAVIDELERWQGRELRDRREVADKLADHADACYTHNATWRKSINANGRDGRKGLNTLYAFMRHWLSAHLADTDRATFDRLPMDFRNGLECLPTKAERSRK